MKAVLLCILFCLALKCCGQNILVPISIVNQIIADKQRLTESTILIDTLQDEVNHLQKSNSLKDSVNFECHRQVEYLIDISEKQKESNELDKQSDKITIKKLRRHKVFLIVGIGIIGYIAIEK